MPDVSELFPMSLPDWREWFTAAAALVLSRCPDDGVAIFFQTDIKVRTIGWLAASCSLFLVHQMPNTKVRC
jgi:hypothetical protein